jgi:hypothetical protein
MAGTEACNACSSGGFIRLNVGASAIVFGSGYAVASEYAAPDSARASYERRRPLANLCNG